MSISPIDSSITLEGNPAGVMICVFIKERMELRDWALYTQLVRAPHKAAKGMPALAEAAIRQ